MEHTYLRYECADTFGLTVASASSKAPASSAILAFCPTTTHQNQNQNQNKNNNNDLLLTAAGSCVAGFHLQSALSPVCRIGHAQQLAGGVGTGRALNGDEVVCLAVASNATTTSSSDNNSGDGSNKVLVATGWVDGAVRIFELLIGDDLLRTANAAHSLLLDEGKDGSSSWQSEPLLLNGHGGSPVRTVVFDNNNSSSSRLASGGSDGTVVLWDVVAETGLYRLLGHRGGVTDIMFFSSSSTSSNSNGILRDGLISCSLDGLVKIWDLDHQCCVQTIASHLGGGEVLAGACMPVFRANANEGEEEDPRWRLITGGNDGLVRVWSVQAARSTTKSNATTTTSDGNAMWIEDTEGGPTETKISELAAVTAAAANNTSSPDDVCQFMGTLKPPPNVASNYTNEKVAGIHYHKNGRYVGVLRAKQVDIYLIRSAQESHKKRTRRLKRRQEKSKKKSAPLDSSGAGSNVMGNNKTTRKRGILDDAESSSDEDEAGATTSVKQNDPTIDPERIKALDEFEYLATVRASHKVRGFRFCPTHKIATKGELCRVVCALATNALETHSIVRRKVVQQGYVCCDVSFFRIIG